MISLLLISFILLSSASHLLNNANSWATKMTSLHDNDLPIDESLLPPSVTGIDPKLPLPIVQLQYHGTTTLAFIFGDSVIIAVDSMASVGSYVGSRTVRKVFKISDHIVATMAGGAADCAYWIRRTSANARIFEFDCGDVLSVGAHAKLLADSLRQYRGSGISVGTMVAGYHHTTGPQCK